MMLDLKAPLYEQFLSHYEASFSLLNDKDCLIEFTGSEASKWQCLLSINLESMPYFYKYDLSCFSPLEILDLHHFTTLENTLTFDKGNFCEAYYTTEGILLLTLTFKIV